MKRFYIRLSVVFLLLTASLTAVIGWYSLNSAARFMDETEQKLSEGLAATLASEFQPFVRDSIDTAMIEEKIAYLIGINPGIDIYLLGKTGMSKAHFTASGRPPVRQVLDTATLDAMLSGAELPLWGPDPLSENGKKPFDVAPLEIMGETGCYLYVVLGSERYDSVAGMLRESYIIQSLLQGFGLVLLVTFLAGLVLFAVLTRRISKISRGVKSFAKGDYSSRISLSETDELGELATTIDHMADTIEENILRLEETDRLRRDLIANISHDLRSPLSSIRGYLETIVMKFDDMPPQQMREYLHTGLANTERLGRLVEELLELSKLDANQIELSPEPFSLADLVQDVVQLYSPRAEQAGVAMKVEFPETESLAYGDIALVERAISNLIDNAIKYTPTDGTVTVTPTWNRDYVEIRISDTGTGIAEEDLPHIFDRFYRAEKSRELSSGGTGLGLAISQKIVELHNSTLSVSSRLNSGTTFSFFLPAANVNSI